MFKLPIDFGKKKEDSKVPASERVRMLSQQGYSETDIIRTLRTEGYSPQEADRALRSAVRTAALPRERPLGSSERSEDLDLPDAPVEPGPSPYGREGSRDRFEEPPERFREDSFRDSPGSREPDRFREPERFREPPEDFREPAASAYRPPEFFPEREGSGVFGPEPPREDPEDEILSPVGRRSDDERQGDIEEVAESIIEEKWGMFERELDEIHSRLEKVDKKISSLELSISEFRGVKKDDVEHIKHSIDAYRESIGEVGSRIEAMERAVKDSLTPMMQSMRSLTDTLKTMKPR